MEYISAHNAEEILMMEIKIFAHFASINIEPPVIIVNLPILVFLKSSAILADISLRP
jgi:hypothetical protein